MIYKDDLLNNKCVACEGDGILPIDRKEAEEYLTQVEGWTLSEDAKHIFKEYKFKNFVEAISFVNKVADIAESEGHHPDIKVNYSKVTLDLWTHAIGGLFKNDFIVAAKVDAMLSGL